MSSVKRNTVQIPQSVVGLISAPAPLTPPEKMALTNFLVPAYRNQELPRRSTQPNLTAFVSAQIYDYKGEERLVGWLNRGTLEVYAQVFSPAKPKGEWFGPGVISKMPQ